MQESNFSVTVTRCRPYRLPIGQCTKTYELGLQYWCVANEIPVNFLPFF